MSEAVSAQPDQPPAENALGELVCSALEWGLIETSEIVDGRLRLSSSARRNLNLRIERYDKPSYLVKRSDFASGAEPTLLNEAAFYAFCANEPAAANAAAAMPPLAGIFDSGRALALEWIEDARSLWQVYAASPPERLQPATARALGRVLGAFHAGFESLCKNPPPRFPPSGNRKAPPYFSFHEPHPQSLQTMSPGRLELCRCLQSEAVLSRGLTRARSAWKESTVIHGDVRSENLLFLGEGLEPEHIRLIDWEFVQRGDPAWDLACALEDHLRFWLNGMSQSAEVDAATRLATARWSLPAVQRLCQELCAGYNAAQAGTPARLEGRIRRAVMFSAARLVQTAWEHCRYLDRMSSLSVLMVQIAANILGDAEAAAQDFYGLASRPES